MSALPTDPTLAEDCRRLAADTLALVERFQTLSDALEAHADGRDITDDEFALSGSSESWDWLHFVQSLISSRVTDDSDVLWADRLEEAAAQLTAGGAS